jgi:hypothetical protein
MRPHLLAMPILVVWTAEIARAADERRQPSLWLLPLMVIWANLHGGFVVGIALLVAFGFPFLAIIAMAAACVTPYGWGYYHDIMEYPRYADIFRSFIGELRPVDAWTDMSRVVALLALVGLGFWYGLRLPLVRAALLVVLCIMALQHLRGLALFALIAPFVVAGPIAGMRLGSASVVDAGRSGQLGYRPWLRQKARLQRLQFRGLSDLEGDTDVHRRTDTGFRNPCA